MPKEMEDLYQQHPIKNIFKTNRKLETKVMINKILNNNSLMYHIDEKEFFLLTKNQVQSMKHLQNKITRKMFYFHLLIHQEPDKEEPVIIMILN